MKIEVLRAHKLGDFAEEAVIKNGTRFYWGKRD